MTSTNDGRHKKEIEESNDSQAKSQSQIPLDISTSRKMLLNGGGRSVDVFSAISNRVRLLKFGSASNKFKQIAEQRDEISQSVPCPSSGRGLRDRLNGVFTRKADWVSIRKLCKEWIRNPVNMALLAWVICVAVSGAILFLVMTGMLNKAIPSKSQRDVWFEVNNQILNALFTLMCLYQHPKRLYHLILLCRWSPKDIVRLRKIYCKNGTYKPHEWAHMMVVAVLLNRNCFAQYALCGLNLGYRRSQRPAVGVGICISVAIGAPAFAGVYSMMSPLEKDYDSEGDEEAQFPIVAGESVTPGLLRLKSLEKKYSFASSDEQRGDENHPRWSGGILDIWDDISLAYLSLFCTFCVFGWNMERLGFGNMYVHIATFLLFCMAPFWIFNLAAVNIDNEAVREALSVTGVILCLFGLLYGGFWRIQMRKRFNLPSYNFCCGCPAISDSALWLCCCFCTLAQEVRTGNAYDVVEDKFLRKEMGNGDQLSPLPREDGVVGFRSNPSSPSRFSKENCSSETQLPITEVSHAKGKDETMTPPAPSQIQRENT